MATTAITSGDLVNMRMSMAATRTLPPGQITRLIDELERLMAERAQIEAALADLQVPWTAVRKSIADLSRSVESSP